MRGSLWVFAFALLCATDAQSTFQVAVLLDYNGITAAQVQSGLQLAVEIYNRNSSSTGVEIELVFISNLSSLAGLTETQCLAHKGVVAVLGSGSDLQDAAMLPLLRYFQIPLVSFSEIVAAQQVDFTANTAPAIRNAAVATLDFLLRLNSPSLTIIYEIGLEQSVYLYYSRVFTQRGVRLFSGVYRKGVTDVKRMLSTLFASASSSFLLLVDTEGAEAILAAASEMGELTSHVWLVGEQIVNQNALLDDSQLSSLLLGTFALTPQIVETAATRSFAAEWTSLSNETVTGPLLFGVDALQFVGLALEKAVEQGFSGNQPASQPQSNLCAALNSLQPSTVGPLLMSVLPIEFVGVTGVVTLNRYGQRLPAYTIVNIQQQSTSSLPQFVEVGSWINGTLFLPEQAYTWPGGLVSPLTLGETNHLNIATIVSSPYVIIKNPNATDPCVKYGGIVFGIFCEVIEMLNVTYSVTEVNGYQSTVEATGPGVYHMALADFSITASRSLLVRYSQPFITEGIQVLVAGEPKSAPTWRFLFPFEYSMWLLIFGYYSILGLLIWFLGRYDRVILDIDTAHPVDSMLHTISLFFRNPDIKTKGVARPVLIFISMFAAIFFTAAYTANLTSFLTVQSLGTPDLTFESIKTGRIPVGVRAGGRTYQLALEWGFVAPQLFGFSSEAESLHFMDTGKTVALLTQESNVRSIESKTCNYSASSSAGIQGLEGMGIIFTKRNAAVFDLAYIEERTNEVIVARKQSGAIAEQLRQIYKDQASVECPPSDPKRGLRLRAFAGLFYISLGFGVLISLYYLIKRRLYGSRPDLKKGARSRAARMREENATIAEVITPNNTKLLRSDKRPLTTGPSFILRRPEFSMSFMGKPNRATLGTSMLSTHAEESDSANLA